MITIKVLGKYNKVAHALAIRKNNVSQLSIMWRDANKVVHVLKKNTLFQFLNYVWVEVCPFIIQYIVLAEQTNDSYIYIY